MKKIIIILVFLSQLTCVSPPANAQVFEVNASSQISDHTIRVAPGRITLIDFGTKLRSQPWLVNNKLARIYPLNNKKNDTSILAVQGLSNSGSCDLTADTEAGLFNIHIVARPSPGTDLIIDEDHSSIIDNKNLFQINSNRTALIKLSSKIDEFVLAGDPELLKCRPIFDFYDSRFLKSFALSGSNTLGKTDLVIATEKGIIKFEIEVNTNENQHNNIIDFSDY